MSSSTIGDMHIYLMNGASLKKYLLVHEHHVSRNRDSNRVIMYSTFSKYRHYHFKGKGYFFLSI